MKFIIDIFELFKENYQNKTDTDYDEKYFDELYKRYKDNTPWSRLRLNQIRKMVQPNPNEKILDIGCASGAISDFCGKFGTYVTGIDLSPLGIEYAKKKFARKNVAFFVADAGCMKMIEDNSYDKAVAGDLVEHIEKDVFEKMLKEAYRVLKPGGTLSIYTPNPKHIIERLKANNIILKQHTAHVDLKKMEEIVFYLEKAGFKIDLSYYCNSFIPVFKWIESLFMPLPWIGSYFNYRICVRGVKK